MRTFTTLTLLLAAALLSTLATPAYAFFGTNPTPPIRELVSNPSAWHGHLTHRDQTGQDEWYIDTVIDGGSDWVQKAWAVRSMTFRALCAGGRICDVPRMTVVEQRKGRGSRRRVPISVDIILDWRDRGHPQELEVTEIPWEEFPSTDISEIPDRDWRTYRGSRLTKFTKFSRRIYADDEGTYLVVRKRPYGSRVWTYDAMHIEGVVQYSGGR